MSSRWEWDRIAHRIAPADGAGELECQSIVRRKRPIRPIGHPSSADIGRRPILEAPIARTFPLAVLSLTLLAVGCGDKDTDDSGDGATVDVVSEILALQGDETGGEALFASSCSGCHGVDGDSGTAPMLSAKVPDASDDHIVDVMINGIGNMAPVSLENQEAADILAFLRASF